MEARENQTGCTLSFRAMIFVFAVVSSHAQMKPNRAARHRLPISLWHCVAGSSQRPTCTFTAAQ